MKFLITGGTGNIGSFLIEEILSRGYSVNYLTRNQSKIKHSPNLNGFFWDIDEQIIDQKCLDGITHIVHLSGESISKRWTKDRKKKILSSRLLTTKLLFCTRCHSAWQYVRLRTHIVIMTRVVLWPSLCLALQASPCPRFGHRSN